MLMHGRVDQRSVTAPTEGQLVCFWRISAQVSADNGDPRGRRVDTGLGHCWDEHDRCRHCTKVRWTPEGPSQPCGLCRALQLA